MIGGPEIRKTKMKWLQEAEVFSIPPYGGIDNVAGNYEWAHWHSQKSHFLYIVQVMLSSSHVVIKWVSDVFHM